MSTPRTQHGSMPDGIARGVHESSGTVSGNARRRKQRSRAVASALVLLSTATIEAETKDAAGPRRHCTWCARVEWHCFSDSSAGPPCDVHIMCMYVVGRIVVERRCGALLVGYEVCHLPSALLGAPSSMQYKTNSRIISRIFRLELVEYRAGTPYLVVRTRLSG